MGVTCRYTLIAIPILCVCVCVCLRFRHYKLVLSNNRWYVTITVNTTFQYYPVTNQMVYFFLGAHF